MFKKSLLALALTGLTISGVANAAAGITLTAGETVIALEGNLHTSGGNSLITLTTGAVASEMVKPVLEIGTAYIVNDLVTFTVSGAVFDKSVNATATDDNGGTAAVSFVDFSSDNTVRFRVTTDDFVTGDKITLDTYQLKSTGAVDKTKVMFSTSAISVNPLIGAYDAQTAVLAATFEAQLGNTLTTALNGEVSTANSRAEFTGSTPTKDLLTITTADDITGLDAFTFIKVVTKLSGNFSWLMDYDADENGALSAVELATAVAYTSSAEGNQDTVVFAIDTALTTLTATRTADGVIDKTNNFEFNTKGKATGSIIVAPQDFSYSSVYNAGTGKDVTLSGAAGKFTLDGSIGQTAFLPFGDAYAQSITVTNPGTVVGAITVDLTAEGTIYSKELTAIATAKTVTNISLEVAAFAAEKGVTGNAAVTVTTNAPDVVVEAVYYHKASADRVLVPTKNQ